MFGRYVIQENVIVAIELMIVVLADDVVVDKMNFTVCIDLAAAGLLLLKYFVETIVYSSAILRH